MTMLRRTPESAGEYLKQRIGQSGTNYRDGINRVTENPAAKAIAAKDKWAAGVQDAIANDRFAKGLAGVTIEMWKRHSIDYGVPAYTQSANKAGENYTAFAKVFYPYLANARAAVLAMPSNTFQDNLQRMIAMATRLHEFKNL